MFEPAPFESANAVGMLATRADELGVETISDLEGQSQDLVLFGSPECRRQRVDCLVGLEDGYGLQFKKFTPLTSSSVIRCSTTDRLTSRSCSRSTAARGLGRVRDLEDDQNVFPAAGNPRS